MMKKLMIILFVGVLMTSCKSHIEYDIVYDTRVPDSSKVEQRAYLLELIEAATKHNGQSAGKAKHLDDVILSAENISTRFYREKVAKLKISLYTSEFDSYSSFVTYKEYHELDEDKNEIYIWYKIKDTGKPYKVKLDRK